MGGQRKGGRARWGLFSLLNGTVWGGPTEKGRLSKDLGEGALRGPGAEHSQSSRRLPRWGARESKLVSPWLLQGQSGHPKHER